MREQSTYRNLEDYRDRTPIMAEKATFDQLESFAEEGELVGLRNVIEANDFSAFVGDKKMIKILRKISERLESKIAGNPEEQAEFVATILKVQEVLNVLDAKETFLH